MTKRKWKLYLALARSYFFGCSDGGREGMMEATRYPDDFDGYVVGDPFFDVPGEILSGRGAGALLKAPDSYIPPALLTLVDNAVYANCDATDGVKDGLIQNPGRCSFRPESLLCKGNNRSNCLTQNQVAKLHAKVANQRRDYLQKTTTEISCKYAHIKIEDLNVSGMIANRKLSAAISDLGFYEFRRQLEYKAGIYGTTVELVDRWFPSSKTCSSCGCIKEKLSLSEQIFECSDCGKVIDRDLNAAINLSRYVPMASRELKPVDEKEPTPSETSAKKRSRK